MKNKLYKRCKQGFTLVELLIVVIIVAILAAIVIPQFSNSSLEAKEAALNSNLSAIRASMELYKLQHNNVYPGATASSGATCPTGATAGTGTVAGTAQAFIDQMTMASDVTGKTCSIANATYKYGPYLKPVVPNEPVTNLGSAAANIAVTNDGKPITATAAGGWATDTITGQFIANNTGLDSGGKAYSLR